MASCSGVLVEHDDEVRCRPFGNRGVNPQGQLRAAPERGERHDVDVFEQRWREPRRDERGHDARNGAQVAEGHEKRRAVGEYGRESQGYLGDERQGTLAADDELSEVVARRGFHDGTTGAHNRAVHEDDFKSEHVVARDAVANRAHAAGVRVDVPAKRARKLAGIDRILETSAEKCVVQFAERDAGLHDRDVVGVVNANDVAHVIEGDYEATVNGKGPTRKSRAGTAGCDGKTVTTRPANEVGNFLGRARSRHRKWLTVSHLKRLVVQVARIVGAAEGD